MKIAILFILLTTFLFGQNKTIDSNILPYISKSDSLNSIKTLTNNIKSIIARDYIVQSNSLHFQQNPVNISV